MCAEAAVKATAYPRLDEDSCMQFDVAKDVLRCGLSVTLALCPECPAADVCKYREESSKAKTSNTTYATQPRAAVQPGMFDNRRYISIHEHPLDMLRPNYASNNGLKHVADLALEAMYRANDARDRAFYRYMSAQANRLHGEFMGSNESCGVAL